MIENLIFNVVNQALMLVLVLSGPPILVSMAVGLSISVFQATTQIQEQTLSQVPKILTVFITLSIAGYWMMSLMVRFASNLFTNFPNFVH
jgi:flagellar biosynthetic protein FliQ